MNHVFLRFVRQFAAIFGVSAVMLVGATVPFIAACGGGNTPIDITDFERPVGFSGGSAVAVWWPPGWSNPSYVIRSTAQFRSAWDGREFGIVARPPLPNVDFSKYILLGVSLGEGNGCLGPRITHIRQVGDELLVDSQLINFAGPTNLCLFESVVPLDFVQIPQTDLPVRFTPTTPLAK